MTYTFSKTMFAAFRAGALVCVILVFSGLGSAQKVVTAKASVPFDFWAQGHEFQAGDYVFDNEVPGFATIHRQGSNSSRTISIILCAVLAEPEPPRLIFVLQDGKYFLVEIWGVQDRLVVTTEFEHRDKMGEEQRQVPLTIMDSHDRKLFNGGPTAP